MKPKSKTMIERHGFKDLDLITKEHDDMVIKLYDDDFLELFLKNIGFKLEFEYNRYADCFGNHNIETGICDKSNICVNEPYNHHGHCSNGCCFITYKKEEIINLLQKIKIDINNFKFNKQNIKIEMEQPINSTISSRYSNKYIIGYIDAIISFNDEVYFENKIFNGIWSLNNKKDLFSDIKIYIEVKTSISNVGETLRQINTYRNYIKGGIWVIITKTKGLKDIFKSQDIIVYEIDGVDNTKTPQQQLLNNNKK